MAQRARGHGGPQRSGRSEPRAPAPGSASPAVSCFRWAPGHSCGAWPGGWTPVRPGKGHPEGRRGSGAGACAGASDKLLSLRRRPVLAGAQATEPGAKHPTTPCGLSTSLVRKFKDSTFIEHLLCAEHCVVWGSKRDKRTR